MVQLGRVTEREDGRDDLGAPLCGCPLEVPASAHINLSKDFIIIYYRVFYSREIVVRRSLTVVEHICVVSTRTFN